MLLEDMIYDISIMTAWSGIAYIIVMPIIFAVAKLKFKVWFDYKKIFKLSVIVAICCYFAFTLISIWIPFFIFDGVGRLGEFLPYIIGEIIGFIIGAVIGTEIVYAVGREIHKKMKLKKQK